MENPYRSPQLVAATGFRWRSLLRLVFFVINFAVAVFFFITSVISIVTPQSPGSFVGGIVAFAPSFIYALCEWIAFYRRKASLERKLGYANFACAAYVLFGVVANVGEVLVYGDPPDVQFLFWFTLIVCSIIVYLVASGWCRLRWTR